jgi:hypothetical protein
MCRIESPKVNGCNEDERSQFPRMLAVKIVAELLSRQSKESHRYPRPISSPVVSRSQ